MTQAYQVMVKYLAEARKKTEEASPTALSFDLADAVAVAKSAQKLLKDLLAD